MSRVDFVAIPTAQRPVELRRAAQSFAEHLSRHEQTAPIIVFHTPKSESEQNAVTESLHGTGSARVEVRYAGLAEKIAMAKDLKRACGISPALLEYALFQRAKHTTTLGTNRNAVLLWGAGRRLLTTDDDTLADLHAHPNFDPRDPMVGSIADGDPADYFVPEGGDLTSWRLADGDPREPAGGLLGSMESAWAQSAALGHPASLVYAGLAGDCGWSAPFGFWGQPLGYLLLNAATLTQLTATPEDWARVLQSRRLFRATSRLQLARDAPGMGTCFGIDAGTELPPCMPVGRGQDLLFNRLVERLQGRPSAWLPFAVAHEPASARCFHAGELLRAASSFDLCGVFSALLDGIPAGSDLATIGRALQELAAQGDDGFAQSLMTNRRRLQQRLIDSALARASQLALPNYWRNDVERYCERASAQLQEPAMPWILDLGCADARSSIAAARGLVHQYGALCEAWPALWRAACVRNAAGDDRSKSLTAGRARRLSSAQDEPTPCLASPYQTWLWRSFLIAPGDAAHVTFRSYRGVGAVEADLLSRCLTALAERHEVLRCRYQGTEEGEALLDLRPASELIVVQRAALGPDERAAARELERTTPIDLRTSPPLRATLVPTGEAADAWELWLAFHHIALDGASEEIFWREIAAIEQNLRAGRTAHHGLAPLRATFRDIVRKQRRELAARDAAAVERHWQEALADAPAELHASYRTVTSPRDSAAVRCRLPIPLPLGVSLRELARAQHCSVAAVLLTAWQTVLARWSGERDIVTILDQSNRFEEAEEQSIGLFMSPLPVRADLSGDPRFDDVLNQNRAAMAEAATWRHIPYERLLKSLKQGRRRLNMFGALFTHLVRGEERRLQGVPLEDLEFEEEQADYEIGLTVEESTETFSMVLIGNRALFEPGDLVRLGEGVATALRTMCQNPGAKLSSIDWLSEADRRQLTAWNNTQMEFPSDRTLVDLLQKSALEHSSQIALEVNGQFISYRDLWRRAEALATRLRLAGVECDERVGLFIDRESSMLEAMLAVLLAGGAYVPLDPAFPSERLAFMIEDAAVRVLLTTRERVKSAPAIPARTRMVCVDDPTGDILSPVPAWQGPTPDSLAYVLYTSGSTGRPKGVEITHRALVNVLWSMAREPGLGRADIFLALTTISGDISGLELWLPLLVGARIVLAGPAEAADGSRLAAALAHSGATLLQATPSTWRALFAAGWPGNSKLKALVGGEALPLDLARHLTRLCGEAWNLYGPTETTIWSSAWKIPRDVPAVRIGRPIANTVMLVMDEQRRPLPLGVTGQLYIGGTGVARGYHGRAELTAERFVADPARPGERLYATGDLARWLPDGELEFLGRNDDQIKIRGFRLEPGEVEAALLRLPEVAQAAVVLHRPEAGDGRLVAYLVAKAGATLPGSADLRAKLRTWLHDGMLPYHFVQTEQLPLTPNGKTDRRRLASRHVESEDSEAGTADVVSAVEAELLAQFSDVLKRPVGLDTDFFEAGGDSLGALRLMARLPQTRTHELTTGELFLHSTPRRMAARYAALESTTATVQHLVTMRQGRGQIPVVFVHPIGGHLTPYARLALRIGADVPLYGLQAVITPKTSYGSIDERCAAYARELTEKWSGPVTLCGYSLGGALAMEIAAQLRNAGREVPAVILLDAAVPRPLYQGVAKIRFRLTELLRFSWADRRVWLKDQVSRRLFGGRPAEPDLGEGRPLIDDEEMRKISHQALCWRPRTYSGKVVLFAAERHDRGYSRRPGALGWDRYCSNLEVVSLPCDHTRAVFEPHVLRIAAAIDAALETSSITWGE